MSKNVCKSAKICMLHERVFVMSIFVDLTPSRKVPEGSQRMRRMALQSQNLKQLTSKIKGKNLKRTALTDSPARNQGDGTEVS